MLDRVLDYIDRMLDQLTMYRVLLYYLIGLVSTAFIFSFFNKMSFTYLELLVSVSIVVLVSLFTNKVFAWMYKAVVNVESVYLTSLILALIITPKLDYQTISFLIFVSIVSTASKFVLAINNKHLFNPAAIAVVISSFALNWYPTWWIGNTSMLPFIIIGGLLLIRKINREKLFYTLILTTVTLGMFFVIINKRDAYTYLSQLVFHSSLLFLGFVMLTEPMTLPHTKRLQIFYAIFVGVLFLPDIHLGSIYTTPELALVLGNIFSYIVSPKYKLFIKLVKKEMLSPDVYNFTFKLNNPIKFNPGQYMEWTLNHNNYDHRGIRRFLTIASSPTENDLQLGVKFYQNGSSYKKALLSMKEGDEIIGAQLSGDFVLSNDPKTKYVFIAGGIGITPFRSMIKYLIDTDQKRDITLFYSDKNPESFVYKDIFKKAQDLLGIKTVYTITDTLDENGSVNEWKGNKGRITIELLRSHISNLQENKFYISGSQSMVGDVKRMLLNIDVSEENIITDYFPGLN